MRKSLRLKVEQNDKHKRWVKEKKNPWSNTEGPLEGEKNPENNGKANKNRNVQERFPRIGSHNLPALKSPSSAQQN